MTNIRYERIEIEHQTAGHQETDSQTHYDRDDDRGHFHSHYCDGVICTALESDTLYIVGMDQPSRKGRNQLRQRVSC